MGSQHTVNYKGIDFEYTMVYSPEEKGDLEYPGFGESFEIYDIKINNQDAEWLIEDQRDEFEQYAIQELKNYNPY